MMNDDKLAELSYKIDNLLSEILMEETIGPLSLSAVFLARMKIMNEELELGDDFNKLLQSVINTKRKSKITIQ